MCTPPRRKRTQNKERGTGFQMGQAHFFIHANQPLPHGYNALLCPLPAFCLGALSFFWCLPMSAQPSQPRLATLSKSFEPAAVEAQWGPRWERMALARAGWRGNGEPSAEAAARGENFAILLPPPNVTGTLHMGHAFNQTVMDSLARYHRMRGFNTAWIPGTDHAGIATQIVVERQLQAAGESRHTLGREAFLQRVWQWREESGGTICTQMRRMGDTVDWSREFFTMDEARSRAVTEAFVRLYEQGLIYRGKRLVNWDPKLKTAVSDLEVESIESEGKMHYICYPFVDGPQMIDGKLERGMTIATTRPETMMADGALAVHPEDERYKHLVGKWVELPLNNRNIPIIADDFVDRDFGSGCVKITGAHDFNDYACAQRHGLPLITIFTADARINENGPEPYRGLDRYEARKQFLADLQAGDYVIAIKPHKYVLPTCARTGEVVEPMLTDQWFVATTKVGKGEEKSIAQKAIDAVESGAVRFVPAQWVNTYNQWMHNIQDWCISRQLWWGHQIPAWYAEDGRVFVARSEEEAQQQAAAAGCTGALTREEDVLDTWFSSALLPFSSLGWPEVEPATAAATDDMALYLPSSVLVTGYDIIFFWVARMVMMSCHFTGRVPFRDVYIHGLVLDAHGEKMSKSEGNVLDPVDLIDGIALEPLLKKRTYGLRKPEKAPLVEKRTREEFPDGIPAYGADALRFTFAAMASLGRSINFNSRRCEGYRNFCNKLWNAARFVLMNCEGHDCSREDAALSSADRWIRSRLQRAIAQAHQGFADYRLDNVASAIYEFVWDEFCDWYLEIAKVQIQTGSEAQQRATRHTLLHTLEAVLRLAHPVIPFVTEALWQAVAPLARADFADGASCACAPYPTADTARIDEDAEHHIAHIKALVTACRTMRSELKVPPSQRLPLYVYGTTGHITANEAVLCALARLDGITTFASEAAWHAAAGAAPTAAVGATRLALFMAVDVEAEKARLAKEVATLEKNIKRAREKLDNSAFASKAPAAVVQQERQRLADFNAALEKVRGQMARLG